MAPRPSTEFNLLQGINGRVRYLGALTSSGSTNVVNNLTTATPFNQTPQGAAAVSSPNNPTNLAGTLAGRLLLLQAVGAGVFMSSASNVVVVNPNNPNAVVALQSVLPPVAGTAPGVALAAGDRVYYTMGTEEGWLQWLSLSGSASLLVWESY